MISVRMILASMAITFAATMLVQSETAMRTASEALGMPGAASGTAYSIWDFNPLTLLSPARIADMIEADSGRPEMKPTPLPHFDSKDLEGLTWNGLPPPSSDASMDGLE